MNARPAHGSARLLVFARAPVAGEAKTRLIPALGAVGAATLHARMLREVLAEGAAIPDPVPATQTASGEGRPDLLRELWCTPGTDHPTLQALATEFGYTRHAQDGPDLGARMYGALTRGPAAGSPAILVGSDAPALRRQTMAQALHRLRSDAEVVMVPAPDGGYVLLGLRRPIPELFAGIVWGGATVAAQTLSRCRDLGLHVAILDACPDVDRPEDLVHCPRDWVREALAANRAADPGDGSC